LYSKNKYTYKYDENGNKIIDSYNSDGNLECRRIFDKKENYIEYTTYNSDGSLDNNSTSKYDYDEKGNWIKMTSYEKGIAFSIKERKYEYYK